MKVDILYEIHNIKHAKDNRQQEMEGTESNNAICFHFNRSAKKDFLQKMPTEIQIKGRLFTM